MISIEAIKAIVIEEINKKADSLKDLSLKIWRNPELGLEEKFAHQTITEYLENEGFSVDRHTPIETSFIARSGTKEGPQIGLLCEYDALPGIGHACGHNLIAEAGVGAGLGLKAALSAFPSIKGRAVLLGTPAEEGTGGKVIMLDKGSFDECDVCMLVHPLISDVDLEDHHIIALEELEIIFHGKAAHAAAAPWEGINALDAAVACYNGISMMRQQMKPGCRVHGIFKEGGEKPNIIPKRATLSYFIRAPTVAERDALKQRVLSIAHGAAQSAGCSIEIKTVGNPFSDMRSNMLLRKLYCGNLDSVGYKPTPSPKEPMLGSTDAGNVSYAKPTIHPFYSIPTKSSCHSEDFCTAAGSDSAQPPTLQVAKAMAMTAIDVICNPSLMQEINDEFKRQNQS